MKFEEDGYPRPTAAGRYCEWTHLTIDKSNEIETFEEYKKTLKLECEPGEPAVLNWTVSFDTPNLVYYQVCFMDLYTIIIYSFIYDSPSILNLSLNLFFLYRYYFYSATHTITLDGRFT